MNRLTRLLWNLVALTVCLSLGCASMVVTVPLAVLASIVVAGSAVLLMAFNVAIVAWAVLESTESTTVLLESRPPRRRLRGGDAGPVPAPKPRQPLPSLRAEVDA